MGAVPADIGDWSVVRIFLQGGRLLKYHFVDMLPVILLFIFPASLIKVWYTQFRVEDFIGPQGSTDPEPASIWTLLIYGTLDLLSKLLYIGGARVAFQVLQDKIYADGRFQSFFTILKLAFTPTKSQTEYKPELLKNHRTACGLGKFLKAFAAITLCISLFILISMLGENFTPEAVAEMGLPPWTIFVFTLLISVITALSATYLYLTCVLVCLWTIVPHTPIVM